MAFFSPLHAIIVPFLFFFTLPIALFASITTFFAFSILFLRVLIVYIELAIAVIPYYVLGLGHPPGLSRKALPSSTTSQRTASSPPARRRKRRNSSSSNLSVKSNGSITPTPLSENALSFSVGPTRDYEGVGGWRLDNRSDDDEDALWTNMNSRLELPADHIRRHHRSLTGEGRVSGFGAAMGDRSYSPENMMNTSRSRARTPNGSGIMGGEGGYFAGVSPKIVRTARTASGSSGSSKGSGEREKGLSMKSR